MILLISLELFYYISDLVRLAWSHDLMISEVGGPYDTRVNSNFRFSI